MNKICWLVDELLNERLYETGYPSIAEAAKELGHRVYQTKYVPFSERPDTEVPFQDNECVVTYGTVQFCKQVEKYYGRMWTPGMYFNKNVKHWAKFAPQFHGCLLNEDYNILPFKTVRWRIHENERLFIKPESGLKEFVGQVVCGLKELDELSPHAPIDDDTLCIVASPKIIKAEFRYVICEKEVIAGTEYRWDNVLDVRRDTHPICDALVKKVAEADWQADTCYVCDIALVDDFTDADWGGPPTGEAAKIIELNAFSSSGLYACDTYKIVEAVSKAALKEYSGVDKVA